MKWRMLGLAASMVLAVSMPMSAMAGTGSNSLRVDQASLHFGDTVTFTGTVSTAIKYEFVETYCWQTINGTRTIVWAATSEDILVIETGHLVTLKSHIGLTVAHNPGFVLGAIYEPDAIAPEDLWVGDAASCAADIYSYPYGGVVIGLTYEVAA